MNNEAFNKVINSHALFKKITVPLKRSLGLSFSYMIAFEDGHYYTLMENLRCLREFVMRVNRGSIFCDRNITDYFDGEYSFTLWPQNHANTAMKIYYKYNAYNGVTASKIGKNYTELYSFITREPRDDWQTFFIRNKPALLEFIRYFDSYKVLLLLPPTNTSQGLFKFNEGFEAYIPKPENIQELDSVKKFVNTLHSGLISIEKFKFKFKANLTPREAEVLPLICYGFTIKVIAQKLGISIKTVNTHIDHIKKKTGLRFKTDIIKFYTDYFYKTI